MQRRLRRLRKNRQERILDRLAFTNYNIHG